MNSIITFSMFEWRYLLACLIESVPSFNIRSLNWSHGVKETLLFRFGHSGFLLICLWSLSFESNSWRALVFNGAASFIGGYSYSAWFANVIL